MYLRKRIHIQRWCSTVLHCCIFLLLCAASSTASAQSSTDFFRTDGIEIVNPDGEPVLMRGVGLGGWLMPEGYMLHVPGFGSPTTIREMIEDVLGPADTETFYKMYQANYVAEKDIEMIAAWGFDHIRLPFHYNILFNPATETFNEDGFALIDEFLSWCKTYGLYVILDMHALPGAQSEHNIADSDGEARLWTEPVPYQDQAEQIWVEIARRYANETQIIGYDLINEPVTPNSINDGAQALKNLYVRLTDAIREVDKNHILFIEGNYFATTFDKLFPPFDDNMVYAFHKYWNPTDQGTIQYLIDIRNTHQTPLWLGESGENSNPWYSDTVQLMERNNIGWNWWTHKKINTHTSPLSAPFSEGYQRIIDYWNGNATKPSASFAREALFDLAANLAIDSSSVRPGVLKALFDPEFRTERQPFKTHTIPGEINAVDFDYGNHLLAYRDTDAKAVTGAPGTGNTGGQYRNDGVDIEASTDPEGFDYNVGWIENNEWLKYTVNIEKQGIYDVDFRVATNNAGGGGGIALSLEGGSALGTTPNVGYTGGWQNWATTTIRNIELPAGEQTIKLFFGTGGYNVNRITFRLIQATSIDEEAPGYATKLLPHYPNPFSDKVQIRFETPQTVNVSFEVFDMLGRRVSEQTGQSFGPGQHELTFRPTALAAGLYVYKLKLDDGQQTHHLVDKLIYAP
ncbi:MAG: cellulase family glycosylhydrolase [Bacteroidota bacterium]